MDREEIIESLLDNIVRVDLNEVFEYPDNPRRSDIEKIAESLRKNKQFRPILIQQSTNYIVAGNHTYQAARLLGWTHLDACFLDVDDDHALRIVLVDNKSADDGDYDNLLLAVLLGEMREENEELLEGTGYTVDDVDELLADAATYEFDEEGDPEAAASAAKMLERLFPQREFSAEESLDLSTANDERLIESAEASTKRYARKVPEAPPEFPPPPSEFAMFRLGELRAKIPREAYERFIKEALKAAEGNLSAAGVAVAKSLGFEDHEVSPALAEGTERWL